MNERIKELALKAGGGLSCIAEPLEHPWKFSERELEKLAELIIDECLRMCDCADVSLLEHNRPQEASGAASVKIFIKEHFGVEE